MAIFLFITKQVDLRSSALDLIALLREVPPAQSSARQTSLAVACITLAQQLIAALVGGIPIPQALSEEWRGQVPKDCFCI